MVTLRPSLIPVVRCKIFKGLFFSCLCRLLPNTNLFSSTDQKVDGYAAEAINYMEKHFNWEEWFQPKELFIRPYFIFEKLSIAEKYRKDVKLMQHFFEAVDTVKDQLPGYFMFNFDFSGIEVDDPLEMKAAFLSKDVIKLIELQDQDTEENMKNVEEKLSERIDSLKSLIDQKIPVEGVIVFPCKSRSISTSSYSVLYGDELKEGLKTEMTTLHESPPRTMEVTLEVKIVLAKLLYYTISKRHYPESEEEAIYEVAMWMFCQSDEEDMSKITWMPYNSIKLSEAQKDLRDSLVNLNKGCAIVSGAYGIGKSVVIVNAIKELISQTGKLKVLFTSAQTFLSNVDVKFSPFLAMTEKWILEQKDLKVITHIEQLHCTIDSLETEFGKETVIFNSYLLKSADLETLCSYSTSEKLSNTLKNFDVVVVEETHALDFDKIERLIACLENFVDKVWISSNAKNFVAPSSCSILPTKPCELRSLRNTPEIMKLAQEMESILIPERYPTAPMVRSPSSSWLHVDCTSEIDDEKRVTKIVELAEKWKWIPRSDLLFIDCESSNLFGELENRGVPVCKYIENEVQKMEAFLFLDKSDPIEAIVAGAEWPVLIVHAKAKTLNEIDAVKVFSKRIISRATTKLYLFLNSKSMISNEVINENPVEEQNFESDSDQINHEEIIDNEIVEEDNIEVDVSRKNEEVKYAQNLEGVNVMQSRDKVDDNVIQSRDEVDDKPSIKEEDDNPIHEEVYFNQNPTEPTVNQRVEVATLINHIKQKSNKVNFMKKKIFGFENF